MTAFTDHAKVKYPIICGAMYPCSNPELVGAVSQAGGLGIIQPMSLVYVYKYPFRDGIKKIKSITSSPFGMNLIVEKSMKIYENRMKEWLDIALEEGCRFFVTALGNPKWVVDRVSSVGGIVYHDVTEKKWAQKALDVGVRGLVCVNNRAGGHAGTQSPEKLIEDLKDFNVPLICAGGIGDRATYKKMMSLGYSGIQMGTRFIASKECKSHESYKAAIIQAHESDIVLTDRVTGVPLSVIKTPYLEKVGYRVSGLGRFLLKHPRSKHWARLFYSLKSAFQLRKSSLKGISTKDFWQAGKSVEGIETVQSVSEIFKEFTQD